LGRKATLITLYPPGYISHTSNVPYITLHREEESGGAHSLSLPPPHLFEHLGVISIHDFTVGAAETTVYCVISPCRIMSLSRLFGEKCSLELNCHRVTTQLQLTTTTTTTTIIIIIIIIIISSSWFRAS
jgi:hypothetical protein